MLSYFYSETGRGTQKCISTNDLPSFLDLIVWGHEHETKIDLEQVVDKVHKYILISILLLIFLINLEFSHLSTRFKCSYLLRWKGRCRKETVFIQYQRNWIPIWNNSITFSSTFTCQRNHINRFTTVRSS